MREGNVFSLSTPAGGTPARGVTCPEYPRARSGWGVPQPGGLPPEVPPAGSVWGIPKPGDTCLEYPPARSVWGYPSQGVPVRGTPQPGQYRGYPAGGAHLGYTPSQVRTVQHMVYLISGGRYASCIHAGGLSCASYNFLNKKLKTFKTRKTQLTLITGNHPRPCSLTGENSSSSDLSERRHFLGCRSTVLS